MPEPNKRSRSKKRQNRRTPGGKLVTHYKRKKKSAKRCARCGKPLKGTLKEERNASKSTKRPERPYGGYLCQECLKQALQLEVIRRFPPDQNVLKDEE